MGVMGDFRDQLLHLGIGGPLDDPGRILQVHQHDVGAALLQQSDAAPQQHLVDLDIVAAQHAIGADLPDHEIGMFGDHVALQPG